MSSGGTNLKTGTTTCKQDDLCEKNLVLNCKHKVTKAGTIDTHRGSGDDQGERRRIRRNVRTIGVVPDWKDCKDTVKILYYHKEKEPPPKLVSSRAGEGKKDVPRNGTESAEVREKRWEQHAKYEVEVEWKDPPSLNLLDTQFWLGSSTAQTYTVTGLDDEAVTIHVSDPHKYKLEINLPPLGNFSGGRDIRFDKGPTIQSADPKAKTARVAIKSTEFQSKDRMGWSVTESSHKRTEVSNQDTTVKIRSSPKNDETTSAQNPVQFTRDDKSIQVDVLNFIMTVAKVVNEVMEIARNINDNVPKVGYYWTVELQVLQGKILIEWQWKECINERCFQYLNAGIVITLVKASIEAGVGVASPAFKLQAFVKLEGGATVGFMGERVSPDAGQLTVPVVFTIVGAIGARAEAGLLAKVEGRGETALELNLTLMIGNPHELPFRMGGYADWKGFKVVLEFSAGPDGAWGKYNGEKELMGPCRLGGFEFPAKGPVVEQELSKDGIRDHIGEKLTKAGVSVAGWSLEDAGGYRGILTEIVDVVDRDRLIRRDAKTIDEIGHEVAQRWEAEGELSGATFRHYVYGVLPSILSQRYHDPAKVYVQKYAGKK